MSPGRDRKYAIKDVLADLRMLSSSENYLQQHASPDIGGLNARQSEGILLLIQVFKRLIPALERIDKDIQELEQKLGEKKIELEIGDVSVIADSNILSLSAGDASIVLKHDGTISIKGKDITITGSGRVQIKADKQLTLKGQKIEEN